MPPIAVAIDGEICLVAVTTPNGTVWRYEYDALGRRTAKHQFSWDGTLLAETTASTDAGAAATSWDWHPSGTRPLTQVRRSSGHHQDWYDTEFHSIISDLIGTPTELLDTGGDLAWRSATSLWGAGSTGLGTIDCPLRFPGQYHDPETGLNYNLHRYYDPHIGAYLTPDPLGLAAGPNATSYVPNPTERLDPLGLSP